MAAACRQQLVRRLRALPEGPYGIELTGRSRSANDTEGFAGALERAAQRIMRLLTRSDHNPSGL